jgi:hypothetical protein
MDPIGGSPIPSAGCVPSVVAGRRFRGHSQERRDGPRGACHASSEAAISGMKPASWSYANSQLRSRSKIK